MGIVRFALRFPHTFYVLAALIVFLGSIAIHSTRTDIFPEIRIPVVSVIWSYTGLSTPEMEQRVTTYSQYSMSSSVTGIENMEAQSFNGLSVQKIYFQPNVNIELAISQIVSATNSIRALMPPGIQPPIIVQFNASSVPVLQISLSSDTLSEQQLSPRSPSAACLRQWSSSTVRRNICSHRSGWQSCSPCSLPTRCRAR